MGIVQSAILGALITLLFVNAMLGFLPGSGSDWAGIGAIATIVQTAVTMALVPRNRRRDPSQHGKPKE